MATEVVTCPSCGSKNRVDLARLNSGAAAVCGRCGTPLDAGSSEAAAAVLEVSDHSFAATVEQSPAPVLLDLWAPWCGPCRMIAPILEQLATEFAGRIRFAKLNVDQSPATASRFRVEGIPTLLLLKSGREVDRIVGVAPAPEIRRRLQSLLTS